MALDQFIQFLLHQYPMSVARFVGILQFAKAHGVPLTLRYSHGHYYVNGYIDTFIRQLFRLT